MTPDPSPVQRWMDLALEQAVAAGARGDVPVGAVVVGPGGELLAAAGNAREARGDPTAHAEIEALRLAATRVGGWRLDGVTVVVTLEPCTMCAGALVAAHVRRLVFGAWDPKAGAVGSVFDVVRDRRLPHRVEVVAGVRHAECAAVLRDWFTARRPDDPAGAAVDG